MKITYDNIIFSLQIVGGISNYWAELTKRISKLDTKFYEQKNQNIYRKELNIKTLAESNLPQKILRYLPFLKKLPINSIFHSSYYRTTYQKNVTKIVTVHDFIYDYFENSLAQKVHIWQKSLAINNADGIICVSNNTKEDLYKLFPNIKQKKIKTIYHGVSNNFFQIKNSKKFINYDELKDLANKKIILYVGKKNMSYKNFSLAVDVVSSLKDCYLVCVGGGSISSYEKEKINKKIKNKFYNFPNISSKMLNKLYNLSFCLLFPSTYEGFGLPIIEAMKAGCPVVASNTSSISEVCADAGILVSEIKKNKFIDAIRLLNDNKYRNKIIHKGIIRAKKFNWDKCYNETMSFYIEVHKTKSVKN